MINSTEYKLSGNEFKVLQFLKTHKDNISLSELSSNVNMSARSLQTHLRVLHGFYIIEKENDSDSGVNKYTVNELEEWRL